MDKRLLDEDEVMQICFVTDDVEKSAQWFAELTGKPMPEEGKAAEPDEAQAIYHGKPAAVGCKIRMFAFGNIDVEFLRARPRKERLARPAGGEGPRLPPHRLPHPQPDQARTPTSRARATSCCSAASSTAAHGRYAYYDTVPDLGVMVELLEFDKDKEPQGQPARAAE